MRQYEQYIVGYLDLLGAKSQMNNDADSTFLRTVYDCYKTAEAFTTNMREIIGSPFKTKIFSDNIIIALPSAGTEPNNHPIIALNRMSAIVGMLQRTLLGRNILSRGSITYGELFIDDLIVFGKALIQAYEIESTVALFPRVVISEDAQKYDTKLEPNNRHTSVNHLRKDNDGMFFLDYLNFPEDPTVQSLVEQSLKWTEEEINRNNKMRVLQKLEWHKNYLESICPQKCFANH